MHKYLTYLKHQPWIYCSFSSVIYADPSYYMDLNIKELN